MLYRDMEDSGPRKPCWQKPCWQVYAHGLHGYVGASALVAPVRKYGYFSQWHFLSGAVQPMRLHQHTRATRVCKSANTVLRILYTYMCVLYIYIYVLYIYIYICM